MIDTYGSQEQRAKVQYSPFFQLFVVNLLSMFLL